MVAPALHDARTDDGTRAHTRTHANHRQGLARFGVGAWNEIGEALLPAYDNNTLRVKTGRLLGSQSIERYLGRKMSRCARVRRRARVCVRACGWFVCGM